MIMWSCYTLDGWTSASHLVVLGLIPCDMMWCSWWTKWPWSFPSLIIIQSMFHTYQLYHSALFPNYLLLSKNLIEVRTDWPQNHERRGEYKYSTGYTWKLNPVFRPEVRHFHVSIVAFRLLPNMEIISNYTYFFYTLSAEFLLFLYFSIMKISCFHTVYFHDVWD